MRLIGLTFLCATLLISTSAVAQPAPGSCGKEGDHIGGSIPDSIHVCCAGLTAASRWKHNNPSLAGMSCADIMKIPELPGGGSACIKCGDGKCDEAHAEDKCNCPADCK